MHKMAEIIFEQELEVIPTYTEHKPPENANQAIWYLGRAIQLMADADYFVGVDCSDCFKGCNIERNVAIEYGIKATGVNMREIMPDAAEIEIKYFMEILP